MTPTRAHPRRRRARRVLLGLLVLLGIVLGWYAVVRIISPWTVVKSITLRQPVQESTTRTVETLRVGCYNIAHARGGRSEASNWEGGDRTEKIERLHQIGRLLKGAQLDIVVLNEVDFSSVWSGHVDQARQIARHADCPYLVEQRNFDVAVPFVSVRCGNAVLSRYPLVDETCIDYPNISALGEVFVGGINEGLICTVLLPDHTRVRILAVHLSDYSESVRRASARIILDLQRQSPLPLIIMGDFNASPGNDPPSRPQVGDNAIELMLACRELTTLPCARPLQPGDFTFPSEKPASAIDWIFVSSPWRLTDKHVLSSDLSDHLPVVAILKREAKP